MGGRASRNKGSGYEREIVADHIARGIAARKTPLSGALRDYPGDVQIAGMIGECKRRKKSFTTLYDALAQQGADVLFIRDDQQKSLVVVPIEFWFQLLKWAGIDKKFPSREGAPDAFGQQTGEQNNG